jgi:O-antigen/teichoic acid export membrane protein
MLSAEEARLAELARPKVLRKNISAVGLGYVVGALAGFGAQTVLARRLGPERYGIYIAAFSLVTIEAVLDELGGTSYLVREGARDLRRLQSLLGNVLLLKMVVNLAALVVALAVALALGFGRTGLVVVGLFSVMFAANAAIRSFRGGLQAAERLHIGAFLGMVNALISALGMVWVVQAGGGLLGAVAFSTAVSVALVPVSWLILRMHVHFHLTWAWPSARQVLVLSLPFALVEVLTFATRNADVLIVRGFLGDGAAGLYGAAYRLIMILLFLPGVFLDSTYRSLAALAIENRAQFSLLVDRVAAGVFLLALPLAAGGAVVGGRILLLIFGSSYTQATGVFKILLVSLPFAFPAIILLPAIVVGEKPRVAAYLLGLCFGAKLLVNLVLVPTFGPTAAAMTTVATDFLLAAAATIVLVRDGSQLRWPKLCAPGVGVAALMAIAIVPLRRLPLVCPVSVGALIYFGGLILLRMPTRLGLGLSHAPKLVREPD